MLTYEEYQAAMKYKGMEKFVGTRQCVGGKTRQAAGFIAAWSGSEAGRACLAKTEVNDTDRALDTCSRGCSFTSNPPQDVNENAVLTKGLKKW